MSKRQRPPWPNARPPDRRRAQATRTLNQDGAARPNDLEETGERHDYGLRRAADAGASRALDAGGDGPFLRGPPRGFRDAVRGRRTSRGEPDRCPAGDPRRGRPGVRVLRHPGIPGREIRADAAHAAPGRSELPGLRILPPLRRGVADRAPERYHRLAPLRAREPEAELGRALRHRPVRAQISGPRRPAEPDALPGRRELHGGGHLLRLRDRAGAVPQVRGPARAAGPRLRRPARGAPGLSARARQEPAAGRLIADSPRSGCGCFENEAPGSDPRSPTACLGRTFMHSAATAVTPTPLS